MIKPYTYKDVIEVADIGTKHFGHDAINWSRQMLFNPMVKLFGFSEDLLVLVEPIGEYKFSIHTIGSTRDVKGYRDFTIDVGSWMFDNTSCTCLVAFASASNKRMQRFIGLTGGKRVGILEDAGGKEDEIMYIYPIRDRKELESRRATCQQFQS
jgi:hypothetical protein